MSFRSNFLILGGGTECSLGARILLNAMGQNNNTSNTEMWVSFCLVCCAKGSLLIQFHLATNTDRVILRSVFRDEGSPLP